MTKYTDILLPVETSSRELDAKLLLALFASEAGFRCHIGTMRRIQEPRFPPSIYVSKSVRFTKSVRLMAGFGHLVVAWDEEGLVRFRDEIHRDRIEAGALQIPRLLFSWGNSNSQIWRSHPFYKGQPIEETGNPRMDLLRPELRSYHDSHCSEIRAKHGVFALLNTNFSMTNHFRPGGRRVKATASSHNRDAFSEFSKEMNEHKRVLFRAFLSALPRIAKEIEPYKLIVRPHPSEDKTPWIEASRNARNVQVVYEGSVAPWLLASNVLIHNGCTSAVEASVLGTPALACCPVSDDRYDFALPNDLSEKFTDCESLAGRVSVLLCNRTAGFQTKDQRQLLRTHIAALEGPLACERIVAGLEKLGETESAAPSIDDRLYAYGRLALKTARRALFTSRRAYENHKSRADEFAVGEIAARARSMGNALHRFQQIQFAEHSPGVVTLTHIADRHTVTNRLSLQG